MLKTMWQGAGKSSVEQIDSSSDTILELYLTNEICAQFIEYSQSLVDSFDPYDYESHVSGLKDSTALSQDNRSAIHKYLLGQKLREILPKEALKAIDDIREARGAPVLLLRNTPIDTVLPGTPQNIIEKPQNKSYVSEMMLMAISELLDSDPRIEKNYRGGKPIHQVIPTSQTHPTSTNSTSDGANITPFHTEHSFSEEPDDFVVLSCLRGNPEAPTVFKSLDDIIATLPPELRDEVTKPHFKVVSSEKHVFSTKATSLVTLDRNGKVIEGRIHLAPGRMFGTTKKARQVIEHLKRENAIQTGQGLALERGDMVIVRNRFNPAAHARTSFLMNKDPNERRWLQRMTLISRSDQPRLVL